MRTPSLTTISYRRDLLGRIVAAGRDAQDPAGLGAWRYNADGTVASETLAGGVERRFFYDGLRRPVRLSEPAFDCALSYRQDGDPAKPYSNGAISAEHVAYKPEAFAAGEVPPSPLVTSYTYDPYRRLAKATATRADAGLAASYDANGNLQGLAAGAATLAFAYDDANRLRTVTHSAGRQESFDHDAAGRVVRAGERVLVRAPETGQLRWGSSAAGTVSFLHDARGWPALALADGTWRLQLRDAAGSLLIEFEKGAGGAAVPTLAHGHGALGLAATWLIDTLYAMAGDVRGSARIAYRPDGKVAACFSYLPYGTPDAAATSTGALADKFRWRFTGQEWIEALGLYDYGARLYDPALGRFLSPDPADQTPSPYMYVGGDPIDLVDPGGKFIVGLLTTEKWHVFFDSDDNIVYKILVGKNPYITDPGRIQILLKRNYRNFNGKGPSNPYFWPDVLDRESGELFDKNRIRAQMANAKTPDQLDIRSRALQDLTDYDGRFPLTFEISLRFGAERRHVEISELRALGYDHEMPSEPPQGWRYHSLPDPAPQRRRYHSLPQPDWQPSLDRDMLEALGSGRRQVPPPPVSPGIAFSPPLPLEEGMDTIEQRLRQMHL